MCILEIIKSSFPNVAGAITSGVFVILIAQFYTKRIKSVDATLEFSQRFHNLHAEQRKLNIDAERQSTNNLDDLEPITMITAQSWWLRFFDLMQFQYHFFCHGLIIDEIFEEWMRWRHKEMKNQDPFKRNVGGISYPDGWAYWKYTQTIAEQNSPFVNFLNEIHEIKDVNLVSKIARKHKYPYLSRLDYLLSWLDF
jgi:hypothetical protein